MSEQDTYQPDQLPLDELEPIDLGESALPLGAFEEELRKERILNGWLGIVRSSAFTLLVVAAVAVLVAMLVLPVLRISGTSMTDTLYDRDVVIAVRGSSFKTGDVIAFNYNNNVLVKRVIATSGQYVDIADDGTVYVDRVRLVEPYVTEKALGDCNIELPYQVPDGKIFVMGDHRSTSLDSRNSVLGCVSGDQVVGRLLVRIWPPSEVGPIG